MPGLVAMRALATSTGRAVQEVRVAQLSPHAAHDEADAAGLARRILAELAWTAPIAAEARSLIVMDGHHRLRAAQLLGLRVVPVVLLGYDDPGVTVQAWRDGEAWGPDAVLARGRSGVLLPHKTTRHVFAPEIGAVRVALERLRA